MIISSLAECEYKIPSRVVRDSAMIFLTFSSPSFSPCDSVTMSSAAQEIFLRLVVLRASGNKVHVFLS